jgi:hypothetical protein
MDWELEGHRTCPNQIKECFRKYVFVIKSLRYPKLVLLCANRLELDDVSSLAEGRQTEINRLHAKLREMNEEINRCCTLCLLRW